MDLGVIFLTGLTTGGLTCLAVQGGLLATTLTRQVAIPTPPTPSTQNPTQQIAAPLKSGEVLTGLQVTQNIMPVLYFLVAKLLAYTLLGFLLGALGSVIQITPVVRAIMQIAAGLFMIATALNMGNFHPIFRYVMIQPPKVLTRLVRNQAKSQEIFAPAVLGLMTILIPCGTTQAMEVLAISSGSPLLGALIMLSFTLGTSPTFLGLGFIATRMRGIYRSIFAIVTMAVVLFLGFVALDGGLNLLGSPLAPGRILASVLQPHTSFSIGDMEATLVDGVQEITIQAEANGYSPNNWSAKSGEPVRIRLVTDGNYGCTSAFVIPSMGIQQILPISGETTINLPAQQPGRIYFTCGMGMYNGMITIV